MELTRAELLKRLIRRWMSDDQTSDPPPFDSLVQLAIDVFMHGASSGSLMIKTEHLRKLEEKWLKMISTVNALPED